MSTKLVAITGGIGCGKSVVARILAAMHYPVYDCDSRARCIIDNSPAIKNEISESLGCCCVTADGTLDRKKVGDIVFSDLEKLAILNDITHAAVREDLRRWLKEHSESYKKSQFDSKAKHLSDDAKGVLQYRGCADLLFVETAILYQSGIDRMVDAVIEVVAPEEIRIERIIQRNGLSYSQAVDRVESQKITVESPHHHVYPLHNDNNIAVLPQLLDILETLRACEYRS